MVAPRSAARRFTKPPAITSVSLFASATVFFAFERGPRAFQSSTADDRRQHDIHFIGRGDLYERLIAHDKLRTRRQVFPVELPCQLLIGGDDPPGFESPSLLERAAAVCNVPKRRDAQAFPRLPR